MFSALDAQERLRSFASQVQLQRDSSSALRVDSDDDPPSLAPHGQKQSNLLQLPLELLLDIVRYLDPLELVLFQRVRFRL